MNQGARDANRKMFEQDILQRLDRIIELLSPTVITYQPPTEEDRKALREALKRRGI